MYCRSTNFIVNGDFIFLFKERETHLKSLNFVVLDHSSNNLNSITTGQVSLFLAKSTRFPTLPLNEEVYSAHSAIYATSLSRGVCHLVHPFLSSLLLTLVCSPGCMGSLVQNEVQESLFSYRGLLWS